MTLILTYITPQYVLQVADRLLTKKINSEIVEFDPSANKNLIYFAKDAFVVMGYCGLAYIGKTRTDDWIAEKLRTETVPKGISSIAFGPPSHPKTDIGQILLCLCLELNDVFNKLPLVQKELGLEIVVAGWQFSTKSPRSARYILTGITYSKKNNTFCMVKRPRVRYEEVYNKAPRPAYLVTEPNGYLSDKEREELVNRLANQPFDNAEKIMVEAIQNVSQKAVGEDCISILLQRPDFSNNIRVRYIPLHPSQELIKTEEGQEEIQTAYSPWIIGPRIFNAPSILTGGGVVVYLGLMQNLGLLQITIEAPETDPSNRTLFYVGTQERPPYP